MGTTTGRGPTPGGTRLPHPYKTSSPSSRGLQAESNAKRDRPPTLHPFRRGSMPRSGGNRHSPGKSPVGWAKRSVPINFSYFHSLVATLTLQLGIPKFMDYRRHYQPGGTYFFTVVIQQRQPLLIKHIDHLRAAFRYGLQRYPFTIDAIVILPDHLHTLWRLPEGDHNFSLRWMVIKRKFSAGLSANPGSPSKQAKREKGIWQRRFWEHCIRDEEDWRRHMDYIHHNPVKHGYCLSPSEWPYSSFQQLVKRGLYRPDWGVDFSPQVSPTE